MGRHKGFDLCGGRPKTPSLETASLFVISQIFDLVEISNPAKLGTLYLLDLNFRNGFCDKLGHIVCLQGCVLSKHLKEFFYGFLESSGCLLFLVFPLQKNTDKSSCAVVDDFAESVAQLFTCFDRHMGKLCVKAFVYQLMQGLSEHI